MSFGRQKPAGWVTNDPITPAQINGIDANLANAFDIVGGEIITGDSEWQGSLEMNQSGDGGAVAWRTATLGDADAVLDVDVDVYVFTVAPTVARTYTLRHTTSPTPVDGSQIKVTMPMNSPLNTAHFEREDTTEIARIPTSTYGGSLAFIFQGGAWKTLDTGGDGEFR